MGPGALAQVLRDSTLSTYRHPQLLVGLQTSDDAAVFALSENQALIQTLDFFAPVVDDPTTYGAIAAANSMSDVYAMGGDVVLALNIVAFPGDLPPSILQAILDGGAAKVAESGGVIAGGHTVTDPEPKYGLAVTGLVDPHRLWTKAGAQPGDLLYLTKALGTGAITTAAKNQVVSTYDLDAAVSSMMTIHREATAAARTVTIHAATDITGFGLLGHASEMAGKGGVRFRISAEKVPLLPGARHYAQIGQLPGGMGRNREHFADLDGVGITIGAGVPADLVDLFYDPETSGPLLLAVSEDEAGELETAFASRHLPIWGIGSVEAGQGIVIDH